MRKLPWVVLTLVFTVTFAVAQAQNSNATANHSASTKGSSSNKNRGPVFRATTEQIKQAQSVLKQRNLYAGEQTGKLDDSTRAGLRKYQEAEGLKVTGTLNKITLQKMAIELTDKQKTM